MTVSSPRAAFVRPTPGLAAHMVSGFTVAGVYGWIPRGRRDHYTGVKIRAWTAARGVRAGHPGDGWDGIPDAYRLVIRTEAFAGETA
jgi:hypothetical protein